jgi:MFS transporter, DHA1 family, multidrug resistance protein
VTARRKFLWILILGTLTAIGPFSIDMYLPGFPAIAEDLNTTVARVALSLSSFFIGISVGQLVYGPLLDRFGRKKPVYVGLVIYLLASIGCAIATTVDALIALRLLQAVGGCVGMVASRAMVRDLFPVEESAKVFSRLVLVIGVSPIIAPTLGGYITAEFGWHYVFVVLALMVVAVLMAVHFALPESRKPDTSISLRPKEIIKSFWAVFKNPQFLTYTLCGSIAAAGLYAYIAGSPYVFMKVFDLPAQQYGWVFALIAMGLITASQVNSFLLRKYRSEQIIIVALSFQSLFGLALLIGSYFQLYDVVATIVLISLFLSTQGFTFPNSSALSMAPFHKNAGSASALMGGIQMTLGALSSVLVSVISELTGLAMMIVMASCAVLSLLALLLGRKKVKEQASEDDVQEETVELISTT